MILQALVELAEREGLVDDPDFEARAVSWIAVLSEDGRFLGFSDSRQEVPGGPRGRSRLVAKQIPVPRFPTGRAGTKAPAAFLVDNAKYVFGRGTADKAVSPTEAAEKAGWFRAFVQECAAATDDAGAKAVAGFLESVARNPNVVALPADVKSNELFAFAVDTPADMVHLRPLVRAFWKARRAGAPSGARCRTCVVTGRPVSESALFPLVRGVPGGSTSGVSFVGFNQTAFESHGWTGKENAPLSRAAAEAASTALSRLLSRDYADPRHPGQKLPRRHVRLSGNTVVAFWSSSACVEPFVDSLEGLLEGGTDEAVKVGDLYQCIWRGDAPEFEDGAAFYALTITGSQGRAMLRDWMETSVVAAARCLARYFADIAIVRHTRFKDGGEPKAIPLRSMLSALGPRGSGGDVPPALASDIVHAALRGTPLPVAVLQKALLRARAEAGKDEWNDLLRRDARAALVKAVLIRTFHQEVSDHMDPSNSNPGYLLGRLMAIVERMQQAALGGDLNASVVDRYFSGASATPAVVFPRLLKGMRNHARKAKDDEKTAGTAAWLESEADRVAACLQGFPAHLNLEQQGLFVLGYHHERHWLWLPKEQRAVQG
jgi:CRISPR-associated protein Csd1